MYWTLNIKISVPGVCLVSVLKHRHSGWDKSEVAAVRAILADRVRRNLMGHRPFHVGDSFESERWGGNV